MFSKVNNLILHQVVGKTKNKRESLIFLYIEQVEKRDIRNLNPCMAAGNLL